MKRNCYTSCVLTIIFLFTSLSSLHLSTSTLVTSTGDYDNLPTEIVTRLPAFENTEEMWEGRSLASKDQTENDEELFKDVDPKRLAAVLLEALNHTYVERERDEEKHSRMEEDTRANRDNYNKEEPYSARVAKDRERDSEKELEMYLAAQGEDREGEEQEEKKKALEEEKITEKVTSYTTSQLIQIQTKQQPSSSDGATESEAAGQQVSSNPGQSSYEEEEQLNPEELKSLETMMKEFPRLNTKREDISEQNQRDTRGYSSYNDIIPTHKGSNLAMSKKKLKWQEETQKAVYFPTFPGGNSIEGSEDSNYMSKATQPLSPTEQEETPDDNTEEEDDEELLSPEEEEARAKVEQEEMMRQAAEAQKAKMEEEKLADIASDMLLSYMVKQNKGDKKHSLSLSNAAEDKRSDEEDVVAEEDDIDPQTIDKLIEISSKLHLPADDVVDIITDVEKKKKKDVPPELASLRQYTSSRLSPFHSGWQVSTNQNSLPVSKQPFPAVNILKNWFQEKNKPKSDFFQRKPSKPLIRYHNLSPKQERWFKLPKSIWTGYSLYPYSYSSYHQRKPISSYYPFYFSTVPRPKPSYYMPKPALPLNNYFGSSMEGPSFFSPKRRYQSWVQPQLRKSPVSLPRKSFFSTYYPRPYSQPFQQIFASPAHPLPQTAQQKQFSFSALGPPVTKKQDNHKGEKPPDSSIHSDVEKYIKQILLNKAQRLD